MVRRVLARGGLRLTDDGIHEQGNKRWAGADSLVITITYAWYAWYALHPPDAPAAPDAPDVKSCILYPAMQSPTDADAPKMPIAVQIHGPDLPLSEGCELPARRPFACGATDLGRASTT